MGSQLYLDDMNMHNKGKTFALILTVILALPCLTLLMAKSANAQNNTVPFVSILYPTNGTFFNVSIGGVYFQLLYQTNDTLSWAGYSIDGGANITCTGNITDHSAYLKDGYQFPKSGSNTLTLYANDTVGNWTTPQTLTYLVNYYPDSYYPPSTSTPSVPELSWLAVIPLLIGTLSIGVILRHRKNR
jgi:hypothetical protein